MERLRIAQVAPPWYPIPPKGYGGIELIVALLADGLADAGQDVTLFATGDSSTRGKLSYVYPKALPEKIGMAHIEIPHVMAPYFRAREFDIIHDHTALGPMVANFIDTPVVMTLHGPFTDENREYFASIGHRLKFIAISDYQRSCYPELNYAATIHHGVELDRFPFEEKKQDNLLFLGRINYEKGPRQAVEVANRLGARLVMAVKMVEPPEHEYFEEEVKPLIGSNTEILGQIDFQTKTRLLKDARCVLFPIQWPEPFGLVMVEAMACGTPVIAFRNGSVPEVIADGVTGFIVDSVDEMVEAVRRADEIDPHACRRWVAERFTVDRVIQDHLRVYRELLDGGTASG